MGDRDYDSGYSIVLGDITKSGEDRHARWEEQSVAQGKLRFDYRVFMPIIAGDHEAHPLCPKDSLRRNVLRITLGELWYIFSLKG